MKPQHNQSTGFTLLESMICVGVLLLLMGAVFQQVNKAQGSYRVEGQKIDLTQQQREFIDQFTRDVRQAGYPSPFSAGLTPPVDLSNNTIAAGITAISPTSITFEGDIDNTGQVKVVTYSLNPAVAAPCPCIQRTVAAKGGANQGTFVEVQNIMVPGPQGIFLAYDANGNPLAGLNLTLSAGATTNDTTYKSLHKIKGVRVSFTLQGTASEMTGATPVQVTMTGMARVPNN
jgi:type II secretory pathway pseudopilin PulG